VTGKEPTAIGLGLYQARVEKQTSFIIETLGQTAQAFDIFVTGPSDVIPPNEAIPVRCYQQKDKNLLVEFKPLSSGAHKIEVLHNREHVSGSPFVCQVFDPNRVLIIGAEDRNATVGEPVQFQLDRKDAGFAELNVVAVSPLGQDLPIDVKGVPGGEGDLIEFTPGVVGRYKLELTYGGETVPGSPLIYIVQEDRSPTVFGKGLTLGQVRDVCLFKIDGRGMQGEPRVEITGKCRTVLQEDKDEPGLFIVKYIPEEVGHTGIHIFWNEVEIPGSPFQARICDASAVLPLSGWANLLDKEGRMDMVVGDTKWNGVPVRTMHVTVRGGKLTGRVVLTGKGLVTAICGEESVFVIDGSEGGEGEPDVKLSGIDSAIHVSCKRVAHNVWEAAYTPVR